MSLVTSRRQDFIQEVTNAIYSNPLTLCSILTGVTVSVDESGTEAAAVTMPGNGY